MKLYTFNAFRLLALLTIVCMFWSCTKEKVSSPPSQQASVNSEDAVQAGETVVPQVVPGTYVITRFIDSSVDETAEFDGYTFDFQDDNDLIATKAGVDYNGKWKTNADETKMVILINGTPELKDLQGKDWLITKLTDHSIVLKRKGPDKVVFKLQ